MFCNKCGNKLHDEAVMCPSCGNMIKALNLTQQPSTPLPNQQPRENVFGLVANILSIISLALCWTIFIPLMLLEFSLPLSIVGMCLKRKFAKNSHLAKRALIKSIIAFAVSIILLIVYYIIFISIIIYIIDGGGYYYEKIVIAY